MKVIALISGGKDSIYNIIQCINNGHQVVCLGHIARPEDKGGKFLTQIEMDCYMYQTVGSEVIDAIAQCLQLPIYKKTLSLKPVNLNMEYEETSNDEVEDLFVLIRDIKVI